MSIATSTPITSIIPCHNAAHTLIACLESCFNQTYPKLEIILIDNNSTDRSLTIAKSLAFRSPHPFKIIPCPEPGAKAARNLGFTHAQGQYIQWLDADDTIDPDKIALQVAALEANSYYDIAYSDWTWQFHHNIQTITKLHFSSHQYDDFLFQLLIDHWHPPHSYLLRRSTAQMLHILVAWSHSTPVCMDREYFTLAALQGHRFLYVPNAHVTYHRHSTQQITQSIPYSTRTKTLATLFQRFHHYAHEIPPNPPQTHLQPHHWQLLQQSRDLWHLPPIQITQHQNQYLLLHPNRPTPIALNYSEAMILTALQKSSGHHPLEDHARFILRYFWKTLLNGQTSDPIALTRSLSAIVGLPDPIFPPDTIVHQGTALTPELSLSLTPANLLNQISATDRIDAVPLFAPVFSTHRWAIFQILERLAIQGILQIVTLPAVE